MTEALSFLTITHEQFNLPPYNVKTVMRSQSEKYLYNIEDEFKQCL